MSNYRYVYDDTGDAPDEHGAYDERTRTVIRKNVSASLELDALRSTLGPTASQLRARVRAALADANGHGGKP